MSLDKINISLEDIKKTKTFINTSDAQRIKASYSYFVKAVSNWVTVVKYKGLKKVLDLHHMTDFKINLIKELWEIQEQKLK